MKTKIYILVTMSIILIISGFGMAQLPKKIYAENQIKASIMVPPTKIPGGIFTGKYLRVGINDGGSLGVTKSWSWGSISIR